MPLVVGLYPCFLPQGSSLRHQWARGPVPRPATRVEPTAPIGGYALGAAGLADAARGQAMKSLIIKRSITLGGRKTSISLEDAFWCALKEIAGGRDVTLSDLIAIIDADRQHNNLSSAIRQFVLSFYRD